MASETVHAIREKLVLDASYEIADLVEALLENLDTSPHSRVLPALIECASRRIKALNGVIMEVASESLPAVSAPALTDKLYRVVHHMPMEVSHG